MLKNTQLPASDRLSKRRRRLRLWVLPLAGLLLGAAAFITVHVLYGDALSGHEREYTFGSTTLAFHFERDGQIEGLFKHDSWDGPTGEFSSGHDFEFKVPRGTFHMGLTRDPLGTIRKRLPEDVPNLIQALESKDHVLVYAAAEKLQGMGKAALPALPRLISLSKQKQLIPWETVVLIALASPHEALPHLLEGVQTADTNVVIQFAHVLGQLGSIAAPAVPELMNRFSNAPPPQSLELAAVIWNITGECGQLLPTLLQVLDTPQEPHTKVYCLHVLGMFQKCAEPAVPQIVDVLRTNTTPGVARMASVALGKIGAQPDRSIPALLHRLEAANASDHLGLERTEVIRALAGFGTNGIPHLLELSQGTNRLDRQNAIAAMIGAGPDAALACEFFFEELSRKNPLEVARACQFFAAVGPDGRLAMPKLRELLRHKAGSVRGSAAFALIRQGELTEDAVKELAANFSHIQTAPGGAGLLNKVAEEHPEFVPTIDATLRQSGFGPMMRRYGMFPALNSAQPE